MARPSFFLLVTCLYVAAHPVLSGEPSFADLKAMAPVLRSSDPGIRTIDVRGYVKCAGIGYVTIRAMYQAPDEKALTREQGALVVRDRRDGTPLLFASERKRFFYDCVGGTLNYAEKNAFPRLAITGDDRELNWSFETENSETGSASFLVDVRSAFAGPSKEEKVERVGARKYRLSMKDGSGDTRVFHVDLDNPLKYEKIEVFAPGMTSRPSASKRSSSMPRAASPSPPSPRTTNWRAPRSGSGTSWRMTSRPGSPRPGLSRWGSP